MAKRVLKERVFAPSGNMLGTFRSTDLETFDIEYEESDEKQEVPDNDDNQPRKTSSVPKPKDDNPLVPEDDNKDDNSSSSSDNGGSGDSGEGESDEDEPYTGELDPYGNDLDDEEPNTQDNNDTESEGGGGTPVNDDSEDSKEESESEDLGDSDGDSGEGNGNDETQGEGDSTENSSGSKGQSKNSEDKGEDSGENQENSDTDDGNGDIENKKDNDKPSKSNNISGNTENSDSKDSFNDNPEGEADTDYEDDGWDPRDEEDSGWGNSDIKKALEELENGETEVDKEKRQAEDNNETTEGDTRKREAKSEREKSSIDKDEARAVKDALGKAIKDAESIKKENSDVYDNSEDELLSSMGASSITTLFNPKTASDWRRNLERVLDGALGFNITTNPNLINKKIEDAPPGREDELPEIKNIVVLLDCSGSMGYDKFIQVIDHLDTMMRVRNMGKTSFHIIDWGTNNVQSVSKTYVKVKGVMFKKEMRKHKEYSWSTYLIPGLLVASQKCHKPDAIIIMTDAEIMDSGFMGASPEGKIAEQFIKKFKKKIIWALTKDARVDKVKDFDPTAKASGRIIKFKNSKNS